MHVIVLLFKDGFSDRKICLNQIQLNSVDFTRVSLLCTPGTLRSVYSMLDLAPCTVRSG